MENLRYHALLAGCNKIKSAAIRAAVDDIIESARVNANDSIYIEKAAPASEWDCLFVGSIQSKLAYGEYSRKVVQFFSNRGIDY